ncbi:AB-hydrolase YheT [Trametes maxima]|nr:AB-hydrolase YheT [Trametes maxima]
MSTEKGVEFISMNDLLRMKCPSLLSGYKASRLLFNGHLQTAYGVYGNFTDVDRIVYDRKLIRLMDGGTLSLDFTPPDDRHCLPADTPIIVAFHGLTGGSNEAYVRSIISPATTPSQEGGLGYRAVVVNFRGCAGTPVTSEQLYHCGNTDDARQALMYIAQRYPNARLIGLGFSLGANVLVRYLAQEGGQSRLAAGCALACPWDLHSVSYNLSKGAWLDRMYSRTLAHNMKALIEAHADKLAVNPKLTEALPYLFSLPSPTLWDFDKYYTFEVRDTGAQRTFEAPGDFYRWASSHNVLSDVRVPLLAINADDDPIVRDLPTDVGGNPLVSLVVTRGGGHLGWFASEGGMLHRRRRTRWVKKPVLEWLRAVGKDLNVCLPRGRPLHMMDGFVMEVGRPGLGCKEVEGGGNLGGEMFLLRGSVSGF